MLTARHAAQTVDRSPIAPHIAQRVQSVRHAIRAPLLAVACLIVIATTSEADSTQGVLGYYRQPAIHEDTVVFVAEGDLWKVDRRGGPAQRLTSHPSEETNPHISPDGRILAFAGSYEGSTEVYTMPLSGGRPERRTVEAEPSKPVGWTPGGKLIYSTWHFATLPEEQLAVLDLDAGRIQRVPLSQASDGVINGDGTIFFTRPRFHNQDVKRYQGGTARNIWKFAETASEAVPLTTFTPRECHSPMWWEGRIYFATDQDGTMNIWSMDENGSDPRQHTQHSGMDVKSPSLGNGRIVYQHGADIWILDIATSVHQAIPITLVSDLDQLREKWITDPVEQLTSAHLHPKGESVALTARGRVFVKPVKDGRLVQASRKKGVRYRDACFLPNGKELLVLSDESQEFEFWAISARGLEAPTQLTSDGSVLRWRGFPSPDGKFFAHADKNNDLWLVETATAVRRKISQGREGIRDLGWSPDSRWIVFAEQAVNTFYQLHLCNVSDGKTTTLTSDRVHSTTPTWSTDGHWLYFLSDRNLVSVVSSPWGLRQPEPYFEAPTNVFRIALKRGIRSPFQPADELHSDDDSTKADASVDKNEDTPPEESAESNSSGDTQNDKTSDAQPPLVEIDLDGIQHRVKQVPVPAGQLSDLQANDKALFWLESPSGRRGESLLMALEFGNDTKPQKVADAVTAFELSADGKKLMIRQRNDIFVVPAAAKTADLAERKLDLSSWQFPIDVREDWRQIYLDAWRLHRDYFYDPQMHGVNWIAVRDKYAPLVERVTSRAELNDVIAQMVGELSTLHTAVRGGDHREGPEDVKIPTLGARLVRDENAGGYRIDYIYQSDPDYPDELSPLADPDLNISEGDILYSINGSPVLTQIDPHLLLRNQQDRQVLLQIRPNGGGELREVVVTPTSDEQRLRYRDWEYTRRQLTEDKGQGQIGYIHLQAMGAKDITQWYRTFYPVFNRQGLIIDVRHNRGGNIDSLILEKLLRRAWFYWKGRVGEPYWNMQYAFRGHMVVLCDEHTASDGEAFAEGFRRLGLGQIIGTRTWGGEIWLTSSNRLSDGGIATAAEFGVYGPEGEWLIEGHGVEPDIVVDNLPHATFNGEDAQLNAAIRHLLEAIAKDPRPVPPPPAYPNKSFTYP